MTTEPFNSRDILEYQGSSGMDHFPMEGRAQSLSGWDMSQVDFERYGKGQKKCQNTEFPVRQSLPPPDNPWV